VQKSQEDHRPARWPKVLFGKQKKKTYGIGKAISHLFRCFKNRNRSRVETTVFPRKKCLLCKLSTVHNNDI